MRNLNRPTALAIAAALLIIGAIGPWITLLGLVSGGPTNDTETTIVIFGGIGLVVVSALTGRYMRTVSIIVAIAILAEAIDTLVSVVQANSSALGNLVSPGWGLYLTILSGLFLVSSTWVAKKQ